ncbi:ATP-binding protein [Myroides odoratimimus]|uniref:ATP-binding protein n=1 Tax=Myroides odoratimimus TaxID=76832 RepID=UPI00257915D5|nr:ATP-binding protein [Myroides odoratimimus]MDM1398927.1 ATP-binding protein [Myroides odoratimimus]
MLEEVFEAKIQYTYDFSLGYEDIVESELIKRTQYIYEIEDRSKIKNLILLIGDEGIGKTTICQEFIKANDNNCMSVIFRAGNKADFSVNYFLENIVYQLAFLLNIPEEEVEVSQQFYRRLITKLRRQDKSKVFYFIIDGLSKENTSLLNELSEYFYLGTANFCYIISVNKAKNFTKDLKLDVSDAEKINVLSFSAVEINSYVNINNLTASQENKIYQLTKGIPSRLSLLKRKMKLSTNINELLDNSSNYNDWLQSDYESINFDNEVLKKIYSLISLSPNILSISDLIYILEEKETEIKRLISENDILSIDRVSDEVEEVTFISRIHKDYFSKELATQKEYVEKSLIYLLNNIDDFRKKIEILSIMSNNSKWLELDEQINDDFLLNSFLSTGDLNTVNNIITFSNFASNKLEKQNKLIDVSLKGSFINYLKKNNELLSEVNTKLAFNDYSGAIEIANTSLITIERLRLYCIIAKNQKKKQELIDKTLLDDINSLFHSCDFTNTGDVVYDIFSDMIHIDSSIVLKLLDNEEFRNNNNLNDVIIAKLSLMALNNEIDNDKRDSLSESIEKFHNSSSRKITRALSYILSDYPLKNIIRDIDKQNDSIEKIKIIRLYLENLKKYEIGLDDLLDKSFEILISNDGNKFIDIEILILLSSKIVLLEESERKRELIRKLRSIENSVSNVSLTIHKTQYELNIFRLEKIDSPERSYKILEKLINDTNKECDFLIKSEAFSLIYNTLFTNKDRFIDKLKKYNIELLKESITQLLTRTANHYMIFKKIIKNICIVDFKYAWDISNELNNTINRDRIKMDILENYLYFNSGISINLHLLKTSLNDIKEIFLKEIAVIIILEKFAEEKDIIKISIESLYEIYTYSMATLNTTPGEGIYQSVLMLKILKNAKNNDKIKYKKVKDCLEKEIDKVSNDWSRLAIVNQICIDIADIDISYAKKIYGETIKNKKDNIFNSEMFCKSYCYNLELLIYSFEAIVLKCNDYTAELKLIINAINKLPSNELRVSFYSKLVFILYTAGHIKEAQAVFDKNVANIIINKNLIHFDNSGIYCLLYLFNESYAKEIISKLSISKADDIYFDISIFFLTKNNPFKKYDDQDEKYNEPSFTDVSKSIQLIQNLNTDFYIFKSIEQVTNYLKRKEVDFKAKQSSYLKAELDNIIKTKLPDKNNIQHNGYKLLAQMFVSKYSTNHYSISLEDIDNNVDNISDRIFVKSHIIENLKQNERKAFFEDIVKDLKSMEINYEYIERIKDISKIMYSQNRGEWTKLLKESLTISNNISDTYEAFSYQKNLIDTLYKIDEKLCKELVETINISTESSTKNKLLKKHLNRLDLAKKIQNNRDVKEQEIRNDKNILYAITESLILLNSGKIPPKKINLLDKYFTPACRTSIDNSLVFFVYYLTNLMTKLYHNKTEEQNIQQLIKKIFTSTNLNFDFLKRLHSINFETSVASLELKKEEDFVIIDIGERQKAFDYIVNWLVNESIDKDEIIIIDPYFDVNDLDIIKLLYDIKNEISFSVLTNKGMNKENIEQKWKEISSLDMPISDFMTVSKSDGSTPFHERYILSKKNKTGLKIGSSLNYLGLKKISDLTYLNTDQYEAINESIVTRFLSNREREVQGNRIFYEYCQF